MTPTPRHLEWLHRQPSHLLDRARHHQVPLVPHRLEYVFTYILEYMFAYILEYTFTCILEYTITHVSGFGFRVRGLNLSLVRLSALS